MFRASLRPHYVMGGLIAVLLVIAAGAGLMNPAIYAPFMPEMLLIGLPVQDAISLLAAPGLVAAMVLTQHGSIRALVLWAGLLVFVPYYYAFYVFDPAYTVVYPIYVALMGLGVYALAGLLASVRLDAFAAQVDERMPVRWIAAVLGMALLFVPIWGSKVAEGIAAQQPDAAYLVYIMDLAFMIPAMTFAAVQVWRRRPIGYLLSGVLLVKAAISGILLTGGSLRQMAMGGAVPWEELGMYVFLAAAGLGGLWLHLRHLRPVQPRSTRAESPHKTEPGVPGSAGQTGR